MRLGFSPLTAMMLDTEQAFRLAAELELDFVELSYDLHEIDPRLQDPKAVRELMRATGVGTTLHLSFTDLNLASLIPAARRTAVDRTLAGLAYAHEVDASCGVLHTGKHYQRHPMVDPMVSSSLRTSLDELVGPSVPIALENLALTGEDYLRTPAELRDLTVLHGWRNCLDFGHAHVQGRREGFDAIDAYLRTLGDGIVHLHLHGNHGERDDHLATGEGTLDYAPYADYLADFRGTICLEIATGAAGVRASVAHLRGLVGATA